MPPADGDDRLIHRSRSSWVNPASQRRRQDGERQQAQRRRICPGRPAHPRAGRARAARWADPTPRSTRPAKPSAKQIAVARSPDALDLSSVPQPATCVHPRSGPRVCRWSVDAAAVIDILDPQRCGIGEAGLNPEHPLWRALVVVGKDERRHLALHGRGDGVGHIAPGFIRSAVLALPAGDGPGQRLRRPCSAARRRPDARRRGRR